MKAAFTICANNYLGSAKVLKESFADHHPEIPFFIVLVDCKSDEVNYNDFYIDSILFVDQIIDLDIDGLSLNFSIAELCTVVKPAVFNYMFKQFNSVLFFDPDIKIYAPLTECWDASMSNQFVLIPHLMTPVDDGESPNDLCTLRTGIFNLGFIGLSMGNETAHFLKWWQERLLIYGYSRWEEGMFYDQIWANYIPAMYKKYYIIRHFGYNVANWNWHERFITKSPDGFMVNNTDRLVFFHFSSYKYNDPSVFCRYSTRSNKDNRPDLTPVFDEYFNDLTVAGTPAVNHMMPCYQQKHIDHIWKKDAERPFRQKLKRRLIRLIEATL